MEVDARLALEVRLVVPTGAPTATPSRSRACPSTTAATVFAPVSRMSLVPVRRPVAPPSIWTPVAPAPETVIRAPVASTVVPSDAPVPTMPNAFAPDASNISSPPRTAAPPSTRRPVEPTVSTLVRPDVPVIVDPAPRA